MAANPSVCAVCLTKDRPEMLKRAVAAYLSQTCPRLRMLIWDSSENMPESYPEYPSSVLYHHNSISGLTIGESRNLANGLAEIGASPAKIDIFAHFDDDDWSHPNRIAEQVALLQSSGADAAGYNEMLFWREPKPGSLPHGLAEYECTCADCIGEAWLYRNPSPTYAIGTSLCYWSETWKRKPFQDLPRRKADHKLTGSEDREWIRDMKVEACSSVYLHPDPRMIASIHGGNSMPYDLEDLMARGSTEWTRAPEYDRECRRIMAL